VTPLAGAYEWASGTRAAKRVEATVARASVSTHHCGIRAIDDKHSAGDDVLIVSWASGGNLPPLFAAGKLLAARDYRVCVLTSAATRQPAQDAGFDVVSYQRGADPVSETAFEQQAAQMMALAAGLEIALDVRDVLAELRPKLTVVDCMLPAGIAAGESTGTPTASLVHFPYGLARTQMQRGSGAWTTDRAQLDITRDHLGLEPTKSELAAWESADLLLVTVPKWFDLAADYPANVVHAGPLGVTRRFQEASNPDPRPRILLSFSTTVMQGQIDLIRRVCDALAGQAVDALLTLGPAVSANAIDAPSNIEPVLFADHDQLLPNTDAVISHGGLGTTLRALAHGKPLLLLPLGRDQHFNARRVVELGAGVSMSVESTPEEIASALVELISQPHYREAAGRAAAAIAADMPDETAAAALNGLPHLTRRPSSA
jgi:UDP:flavonoid glycosyltransferase YjiC (YdhE family)